MISVITPTHDTKYLKELWESLKEQTNQDYEWVLVPNEGAVIPEEIVRDERVKIYPLNIKVDNIGSLKNFAFSKAQGEILLECDHDDILMPTALEECEKAFRENSNICFAYSNSVNFDNNWNPTTYSASHGWRYRDFEYKDKKLKEAIAFKATPQSLAYIYYAPNHFRAWKREAYQAIGGHDINMKVIDDHDLLCRTYIYGEMYHIDKPLYLYRIHGENSWLKKNAEVQQQTREVYNKYLYKMVETWCDRNGHIRLDCGSERGHKPNGWKTIDIREGCDYKADLRKGFPFSDNSIGAIRAWDFLEHLPDKVFTMNEIHRVLVPGGWLLSGTPSSDGRGAYQDPTHVSFWNENSFWYYTKTQFQNFVPEITAKFQSFKVATTYPSSWHEQNKISYVVSDLVAIKNGYCRNSNHIPNIIEI